MHIINKIKQYFHSEKSKTYQSRKPISSNKLDEIKLNNDWHQVGQDMYFAIHQVDEDLKPKSKK